MAERDPDIVIRWLADRVDVANVPDRPVVLDLDVSGTGAQRFWLVLERGTKPSICIEDPLLAGDRYVFVEADVRALYPIARRTRDWSAAIGDGSVQVFGAPQLVEALPSWFGKVHPVGSDSAPLRLAARGRSSVGDDVVVHVATTDAAELADALQSSPPIESLNP